MSTPERPDPSRVANVGKVDIKLDLDVVPVSDVDGSKEFYERIGWRLDDDVVPLEGLRIIALRSLHRLAPPAVRVGGRRSKRAVRRGQGEAACDDAFPVAGGPDAEGRDRQLDQNQLRQAAR
jgi:hypothetical protein